MLLNKKAVLDLWVYRWQSIAIILVIACGVALYSGIDMAFKSLNHTRDRIYSELHFADLEVTFLPTDTELIPDFKDIEGIEAVERRMLFPGSILLENNRKLSGVLTLVGSPEPKLNSFKLVKGTPMVSNDLDSVVIEQSLARYHGFKPGDIIKIKVGEKLFENKIAGVVISPEYVTGTTNPEFFSPGKGTFGPVFGNIARNKEALGFSMANDLIFKFSKGADAELVKQKILKKVEKLQIEKVTPQKEHFSFKYMDLELRGFALYTPAMIIIMEILSFTTGFVIYNRFLAIQRKEIGTLLCLGYTKKEITHSFLIGAFVLGVIGSILGLIFAIPFRNVFAYFQYSALDLPVLYTKIYAVSLVKGMIFGIVIILIPPLMLLSKLFKLSPQDIIRATVKESPFEKGMAGKLLDRVSFKSFEVRYTLRNMLRQKWLTLSTILCIGLSIGVSISYISSITSINETLRESFEYEDWDLGVDFMYPMFIDEVNAVKSMPGVKKHEPFIRRFVEITANKKSKDSTLLGINPQSKMKRVRLMEGRWFSGTDNKEIIVNQDISDGLNVKIGEWVEVKHNEKYFKFKVIGIASEIAVGQSMIPFEESQQIFENFDEATGIFVTIDESQTTVEKMKNAFYEYQHIGSVTKKNEVLGQFIRLMHDLLGIVYVSAGFSVIVALVFIYTNINLVIFERKEEFALLRSLGYSGKSIKKIISLQSMINGIMGCFVSIPIAMITTAVLNQRLDKFWYHVYNHYYVADFLSMIVPALLLMPFMAMPAVKHICNFKLFEVIHQKNIE